MKVYYHQTDGGAEYLSFFPEGPQFNNGIFARVDGDEIEIFKDALNKRGLTLKLN